MNCTQADDVAKRLRKIVKELDLSHIKAESVSCFRSTGSTSRAIARIWSFPKIWQQALNLPPHYIIEVVSERFDKLDEYEKHKVLIHELMHIPKNFSGALLCHKTRWSRINNKTVEQLFKKFIKLC